MHLDVAKNLFSGEGSYYPFELLNDGILVMDNHFQQRFINSAGKKILKNSNGHPDYRNLSQIYPHIWSDHIKSDLESLNSGQDYGFESFSAEDAQWLEHSVTRHGNIFIDRFTDITARKAVFFSIERESHQLRSRFSLLEKLLSTLRQGIFMITRDGKLLLSNQAGKDLLNTIADMNGLKERILSLGTIPLQNFFTEKSQPTVVEYGSPQRTYSIYTTVVKEEVSMPRWVFMVTDITQEREFQSRIEDQQRLASIGLLAAGIAHDFNNILVPIMSYSELGILKTAKDNPLNEYFRNIYQSSERAKKLVQQILAFSRKQILQIEVVNLNRIIENFDHILKSLVGENIQLQYSLTDDLPPISTDVHQLEQIILNLIINARDAMPQGGTICIETSLTRLDRFYVSRKPEMIPGMYIMLSITDTGCGIPPENLQKIFEPFFTTKPRGQGTGLGLSTVHGIVRQHGWHIFVYSEVGKGTTFKIYIPPEHIHPESGEKDTVQKKTSFQGDETILVVEDEQQVLNILRETLLNYGYRLCTASSISQAQKIFQTENIRPDLLITDIILPDGTGDQLEKDMRTSFPNLKVLYISGYSDNVISVRGILQKEYHFLQKPFAASELVRVVRQVLDSKDD